ncbi:chromate transporter [Gracilibacillus caseinilyticus]|uniref:Chromate transporter n=1 Tax=Gracilibacillus caseinilyticus TaxID=2932256 RepID=A0ABY4EYF8_9BACI|nr:chromate transporter [Gracilibacillus caseinilyticus]UOQ49309.1 chromate transporter [Gracilibacillus caseinilyticus]
MNGKMLVSLFMTFLKISPMTFGGGYAMIPLIEKEIVDRKKWVEAKDLSEIFALAQSVPGAIAINAATFVGYRLAGVMGALVAMIGILLPTFLIVVTLSMVFVLIKDNALVADAFMGIRPAIVALIAFAAYRIGITALYDKTTIGIAVITVVLLFLLPVHPVVIIIGGIIVGLLIVELKKHLGFTTHLEKVQKSVR